MKPFDHRDELYRVGLKPKSDQDDTSKPDTDPVHTSKSDTVHGQASKSLTDPPDTIKLNMDPEVIRYLIHGKLIRHGRKKSSLHIKELAEKFNVREREWKEVELGRKRFNFALLVEVYDCLAIPLDKAFGKKAQKFNEIILQATGKTPAKLAEEKMCLKNDLERGDLDEATAEEKRKELKQVEQDLDEIYELFLDLEKFEEKPRPSNGKS